LGVGGGCAFNSVHIASNGANAGECRLALLKPGNQLHFSCLTNFRPGAQGNHGKHHSQAEKGEAVVGDIEKTLGHVAYKYAQAFGETVVGRCHSSSFLGGMSKTPRLGWYAINILRRRFDMCSDLNMPGSAADAGYP
jgi:hypothetical protein